MSQNTVDFSGDPSGDQLLDNLLTPMKQNILTHNSGTSRPSYAVAHTTWTDTTSTPWILKYFDGTDDIVLGYVNASTNAFTPAGIRLDNIAATTNPTINDDSGDGYSVGSLWVNVTADESYVCVDASLGAASWKRISLVTVTNSDMATMAARTVKVNATNSAATPTDFALGAKEFLIGNDAGTALIAGSFGSGITVTGGVVSAATKSKNEIINGDMKIWQRGTSIAAIAALQFGPDRWHFYRNSLATGATVARSTDAPTGFQYSAKLQRDNGNAGTQSIFFNTALETADSIPLAGKTVTVSYYAKAGANFTGAVSASVYTGTGTDQSLATIGGWTGNANPGNAAATGISTSWQRFNATFALSSSATQIGIQLSKTNTGTAGADDSVYIAGVQLEVAGAVSDFAHRTFQDELALCQRYYAKTFEYTTAPAQNAGRVGCIVGIAVGGGGNSQLMWRFPRNMRTSPTITTYNPNAANANVRNFSGGSDVAVSVDPNTMKSRDAVSVGGAVSGGAMFGIHVTADAEL